MVREREGEHVSYVANGVLLQLELGGARRHAHMSGMELHWLSSRPLANAGRAAYLMDHFKDQMIVSARDGP